MAGYIPEGKERVVAGPIPKIEDIVVAGPIIYPPTRSVCLFMTVNEPGMPSHYCLTWDTPLLALYLHRKTTKQKG